MIMKTPDDDVPQHNRLVLCFDGTAKTFAGNNTDSNVVKIYQMLDRNAGEQYHYYQPGIGTYIDGDSGYGFWHSLTSFFSMGLDQALGLSFRHHVVAGYQFIMRYYSPGDHIYIIGFSRGAYTARFLSEMLDRIGLLSRGNEEMVSFAWKAFSDYQNTRVSSAAYVKQSEKNAKHEKYMADFKKTFCRDGVRVHFLGLFDCVNSVGQFACSYQHIGSKPATHIRHAVSINERRIKFKPALFDQAQYHSPDHVTEMWFAGAHGDVGGGWPRTDKQNQTLSTLSLKWMINEILDLPDNTDKLKFGTIEVEDEDSGKVFDVDVEHLAKANPGTEDNLNHYVLRPSKESPTFPKPHDELCFGRANATGIIAGISTLVWKFMDYVPLFSYLVYHHETGIWRPITFPPNKGSLRDIPDGANIHPSVKLLHEAEVLEKWEVEKALYHMHPANTDAYAHSHDSQESEPLLSASSSRKRRGGKR